MQSSFQNFLTTSQATLNDIITAGFAFCGLALAFAYFVMEWATGRVRDLESSQLPRRGAPMLVCWIGGVGTLLSSMLGAHLFLYLYFVLNMRTTWVFVPMISCMAGILAWNWITLIGFLIWFLRHPKEPPNAPLIKDWRRWEKIVLVLGFLVVGIGACLEGCFGEILAALFGFLFELCAAFGAGAYWSILGDLLPRASLVGDDKAQGC
ncbi:MAG: hypothetical protein M5U26_18065 [Planctomycetota bacterium]|nr:hypothetical protein [Planctomycetota bacterium]